MALSLIPLTWVVCHGSRTAVSKEQGDLQRLLTTYGGHATHAPCQMPTSVSCGGTVQSTGHSQGEEVEKVLLDDQDAHHRTTDGLELAQGVDVVVVSLVLDGPLRLAVQFFDFVLSVRTNVRVESFEDMVFPL